MTEPVAAAEEIIESISPAPWVKVALSFAAGAAVAIAVVWVIVRITDSGALDEYADEFTNEPTNDPTWGDGFIPTYDEPEPEPTGKHAATEDSLVIDEP